MFLEHITSQALCQTQGLAGGKGRVLSAGSLGGEIGYVYIKRTKGAIRKSSVAEGLKGRLCGVSLHWQSSQK